MMLQGAVTSVEYIVDVGTIIALFVVSSKPQVF